MRYGVVLCQVQDLIQEILLAAIAVNRLITSPWADYPDSPHKMTLRASMGEQC